MRRIHNKNTDKTAGKVNTWNMSTWERIWNEDPSETIWERIWGKEE